MGSKASKPGRRRNRGGRVAARAPAIGTFERRIPYYDLAPEEAVETIHRHALRLLEEIGIEFRDPPALDTWRDAGATLDGARVRIPPDLVMDCVALAPSEYVQHARNRQRSTRIGGRHMVFSPVYGAPFVRDLDGRRRYGTLADYRDLVKLAQSLEALNHGGGAICEPMDVPVAERHLDMIDAHLRYSDKPFMGSVTSAGRARDCVEACKIVFGADFVQSNTVMTSLINANSPLVWDATMLEALRVYARNNQAVIVSPFAMQGASTPVTGAGALVQIVAEALAGIAYMQLVGPGSPSLMGITPGTASMKTGAPMYGVPEAQLTACLGAQLARRYEVPVRLGGLSCASNAPDAQAAYESMQNFLPPVMAGGHFFIHCAGWLEGGLSACLAKFVIDAEQLGAVRRLISGIEINEETLAWEALKEIEPGTHFFASPHTLRHFRDTFHMPETVDGATHEQWLEEGAKDMAARARGVARRLLEDYRAPPLDDGIAEALTDFIARRKAELSDAL